MDIGTAESVDEPQEKKTGKSRVGRLRSPGSRTGGSGNGGNDDNKWDDGPGPEQPAREPVSSPTPEKSRVLMWFLLMVVVMTFSGLIAAYIVISTNSELEWRPFSLPTQVWVSTFILVASSLTYDLGKRAVLKNRTEMSKRWFLLTTVLGAMFISSQILTWLALVERGFYLTGNPYAGFFYILTGVHAAHVIGGICALGYILLMTWNPPGSSAEFRKRATDATVAGWYWHTMDLLWLVLLFLLGFWK